AQPTLQVALQPLRRFRIETERGEAIAKFFDLPEHVGETERVRHAVRELTLLVRAFDLPHPRLLQGIADPLLDPAVVVPPPFLCELREILPVLRKELFELLEESLEFRRVEPRRLLRALLGGLQQLLDAAEVEIEELVEYRNVDRPFDHRG